MAHIVISVFFQLLKDLVDVHIRRRLELFERCLCFEGIVHNVGNTFWNTLRSELFDEFLSRDPGMASQSSCVLPLVNDCNDNDHKNDQH